MRGNVKALENSQLFAFDNTIRGNIEGDKADVVRLVSLNPAIPDIVGGNIQAKEGGALALVCGQTLPEGNIQVEKFGPNASVGVGDDEFCAGPPNLGGGNILEKGNIKVEDNTVTGSFGVDQNQVGGDIQVFKNRGSALKTVAFNIVREDLQCKENDPPFFSSFNVVGGNAEDQCGQP